MFLILSMSSLSLVLLLLCCAATRAAAGSVAGVVTVSFCAAVPEKK